MWLLGGMILLGTLRTMQLGLETDAEETGREIWCFTLLSQRYGPWTKAWLYVVFPVYVVWVAVGTLIVALSLNQVTCIPNSYELCYFITWLGVFYLWMVIYAYAIYQSWIYIRFDPYRELRQQYEAHNLPLSLQEPLLSGLSYRALARLEIECVSSETDTCCAICLETLAPGNCTRALPCHHQYHLQCIDDWLLRNATCPVCKRLLRARRQQSSYSSS